MDGADAEWSADHYTDDMPNGYPGDEESRSQRVRRLLRRHGWLVAASAAALIVLFGSRLLLTSPTPNWQAAPPESTETSAAASLGPSPSGPRPTPTPTAKPSATPSASPSKRATSVPTTAPSSPRGRKPTTPPKRKPTTPAAPTAKPPAAPVLLGPGSNGELWGMLSGYCAQAYNSRQVWLRAGPGKAENNWECRRTNGSVLIDMNAACRHSYGDAAFASYTDPSNAFSWRCYRRG